jgi:long-chain acyl-CoA synthetase
MTTEVDSMLEDGPLQAWDRNVQAAPLATAVQYLDRKFTFREIDHFAGKFAAAMRSFGVNPGDRIAVLLQNTPHFNIVVLAAWKIGAVVVPLNVMYKSDELNHYLADCKAKIVVCDESVVENLNRCEMLDFVEHFVLCRGDDWSPSGRPEAGSMSWSRIEFIELMGLLTSDAALFTPAEPRPWSATAVLAYTSGTTGRAKGVQLTHGNLGVNSRVGVEWLGLSPKDVILAIAPMFHITGLILYLCASIQSGATILMGGRFEPVGFLDLIARFKATCTVAPITAFIALMDSPEFQSTDLSGFTKLVSGGAPTPEGVVRRWMQSTGVYICNAYGLTETASVSLRVPLGQLAPTDPDSGALSVGTPTPATSARIVSTDTRSVVGEGEVGELQLKGPHIAVEYYGGNGEVSRITDEDGWFDTGDIAICRAGWYFIIDRLKDVIIASGFKVWPREVEDCLHLHPAVSEVAVVGVPDTYRGETVAAYVVLRKGHEATADDLREHTRRSLAAFKCPTEFHLAREIPKTASGKVLRRQLRNQIGVNND